ncbi:MAG: 4-hydroxy-tetrahydrodipicolinate synthase [Oscillospiraceae bacterium]|nr:4-hydroxy-tetrahydrodipicolinate synthase [Oscillospiraceae bacterium]
MTSNPIFRGVATALVTPTTADGVDYEALGRLIDWQIEEGINALVIAGTTGEGSTLSVEEHKEVIRFSVQRVNHRIPVIGGTGSNDTATAIELTKSACEDGVDACLVVTPYYNKATQNGLIAMYKAIADASTKPIIMYNVPSRTGVNIEPSTYAALAGYPNIAAIKEANGNISKIVEAAGVIGDQLDMYSGNDDQVVPILSMGGSGVISVVSNVAPRRTVEMCDRYFAGDVAGAAEIQCELFPLIRALFCEVNPIPVKAAMAAMGFCENYLRMPLCPMSEANEKAMLQIMRDMGILQ